MAAFSLATDCAIALPDMFKTDLVPKLVTHEPSSIEHWFEINAASDTPFPTGF
jgi:hypothetical protein